MCESVKPNLRRRPTQECSEAQDGSIPAAHCGLWATCAASYAPWRAIGSAYTGVWHCLGVSNLTADAGDLPAPSEDVQWVQRGSAYLCRCQERIIGLPVCATSQTGDLPADTLRAKHSWCINALQGTACLTGHLCCAAQDLAIRDLAYACCDVMPVAGEWTATRAQATQSP